MAIRIREGTLNDCSAIAKVHVDSWRTTYNSIVPNEYLINMCYSDSEKRWIKRLQQADNQHKLYVAENESGTIVGFAGGGRERSGEPGYDGELYAIYLLKEFQRQGIGKLLFKAVVDHLATQFRSMLVWVLAENDSRYFYEALGGIYIRESTITIAGKELKEVAYGWSDIRKLKDNL
jgi:GNAT superfamily N-acetyltransferase